jgi:predicted acylesterase/phospholipase RssA
VIVATRLSVAFPLLISATPLWRVDENTDAHTDRDALPLERCWFSDGGLSSNFPVHFFDQLIPSRPTFAIDLRDATDAYPIDPDDERKNVWTPLTNDAGRTEWFTRFDVDAAPKDRSPSPRNLVQFAAAALSTVQNWRDNTLAHESGFRDRIAHVKLDPGREGGLNLAMPTEVIARLGRRGEIAGAMLRERFTMSERELRIVNARNPSSPPITVSWDNHRWLRYRIAMAALQEALAGFNDAYAATTDPYRLLVIRGAGQPPTDFPWSAAQRNARPARATQALLDAFLEWRRTCIDFGEADTLPESLPELRLTPRV